MRIKPIILLLIAGMYFSSCEETPTPELISITPSFGPAGTLVTFEGVNLGNIIEMKFSEQVINFNTAYNSDNALLFRIPENIPLGNHIVSLETEGGLVNTEFRVTLDPPEIFGFTPESADAGQQVTIYGENFFDPVSVYFFDSIQANILTLSEDSIEVIVPEGVEIGSLTVVANGGVARSPIQFFSTNTILVNDFDGNGVRAETNKWIFVGSIDQNGNTAVQNNNPAPIDGNYLKLSGRDELGIGWIGGAENHTWDTDVFETFQITTDNSNTLFEMDVHSNGRDHTHVLIVLLEKDGSRNDFTHQIKVSGSGWKHISLPLNRFKDLNDVLIDPAKIKTIKIRLNNVEDSNLPLEVNVDNIRFVEIL